METHVTLLVHFVQVCAKNSEILALVVNCIFINVSYSYHYILLHVMQAITKGKIHHTTDHDGTEKEYRYSSIVSLTSAVDVNGCSTSHPSLFTIRKYNYTYNYTYLFTPSFVH
jgi:hypothetical protein